MEEELKQFLEGMQREIITAMRQENTAAHAETRSYVEQRLAESVAEMRHHFDLTIEQLDRRFEANNETIRIFDESVTDRHEELERRVVANEDEIIDLQVRVGRLEKPKH